MKLRTIFVGCMVVLSVGLSQCTPTPPTEPPEFTEITPNDEVLACSQSSMQKSPGFAAMRAADPLTRCDWLANLEKVTFSPPEKGVNGYSSSGTYTHEGIEVEIVVTGSTNESSVEAITKYTSESLFCFEYVPVLNLTEASLEPQVTPEPNIFGEDQKYRDQNLTIEFRDIRIETSELYGLKFAIDPWIGYGQWQGYPGKTVSAVSQYIWTTSGSVSAYLYRDHYYVRSTNAPGSVSDSVTNPAYYTFYVYGTGSAGSRYGLCGTWNVSP